ncbi:hypothetical protein [Haloferax sp. Q22]|uniref:hypothetical protein n=1 Tax=Haloferax sp. (strain Q22) TaxID=1526048 RepID=UPI000737BABD|nr:hypothetical protein [Haloferax sp. Q22]
MNTEKIDRRAREIDSDNTVRQKGTRTRASIIAYFDGNDFEGTIHRNADTYAAFVAVVTDSGRSGFEAKRDEDHKILKKELADAFRDAGFVNSDEALAIPGRDNCNEITGAVGPLMPAIVAILETEHGIDSTEAVRQYRPDSLDSIRPTEEPERDTQVEKDWKQILQDAAGSDPDAEAYVYVLKLKRVSESSTWFYVGKSEGGFTGLLRRIRSHAKKFNQSRVVTHEGKDILVGDYNFSIQPPGTTHELVDIERIVSISEADLAAFDDADVRTCYIAERERRTAYEVALDHETTNVLGGK